jgi:heat shock protein HslJ
MQAVELSALQKEWQLVSIDNNIINAISYLNVDIQATATGNLACNSFFGTLELQQNKLRIDKMGSTRKMCEPKINTIEMMVSSTLSTWSKVKVDGQKLILTGHKHTLIYNLK